MEMMIHKKQWDDVKCKPEYVYLSGILNPDSNLGPVETTIKKYNDCMNLGIQEAIDEMDIQSYYHTKTQNNKLKTFRGKMRDVYKSKANNASISNKMNQINDNLIEELELTVNTDSAIYYNYLKNVGIYIDQIDALMEYIYNYVKNYLSYVYYSNKKHGREEKAEKIEKILNDHFDGIKTP